MTIRAGGPMCDVCDSYILLDASINPFNVQGIEQVLHCHDRCKEKVVAAFAAKDWRALPDGALRRTFAEHYREPQEA